MEQSKERPIRRVSFRDQFSVYRKVLQYRTHPEVLDPMLVEMEKTGIPEPARNVMRTSLVAMKRATDDKGAAYRLDMYLVAGMGAVDLILLQTLLPLGARDQALFFATLCLAVSLVFVSWSLFIAFVKRDQGIKAYGKIHSSVVTLALLSGLSALAATFWHASTLIGVVFSVLAAIVFILCAGYTFLARTSMQWLQLVEKQAPESETSHE